MFNGSDSYIGVKPQVLAERCENILRNIAKERRRKDREKILEHISFWNCFYAKTGLRFLGFRATRSSAHYWLTFPFVDDWNYPCKDGCVSRSTAETLLSMARRCERDNVVYLSSSDYEDIFMTRWYSKEDV